MKLSLLCFLGVFGLASAAWAQQCDLVALKTDQANRLAQLQSELTAAGANTAAAADVQKKIDAVDAENLWSKTDGPPAMPLVSGDTFHPFNFAVLSDLHLSERKGPERFERAMELIGTRHDIAFVLIMGDLVWTKDPAELKAIAAKAGVPVHLVYGNNDWKWIQNGTYERAFGPRDYVFTYNNCTFIMMDDCLPKGHYPQDHKGDFSSEQWSWLEHQLAGSQASGATHSFVGMHIPPDAPGAYDPWFFMYTNTEKRFFDLLEKYNASCGLFGHLHQSCSWVHDQIPCYVTPSCCWNFIAKGKKVDSSFCRIVKVEQDKISDALLPVWLDGETFTYETLAKYYNPADHPK